MSRIYREVIKLKARLKFLIACRILLDTKDRRPHAQKFVHMHTRSSPQDVNVGTEKKQLFDLESQLLVARRQLAVLKRNVRGLAKVQKVCDGSICSQNCPREAVLARPNMSDHVDSKCPSELLRKAARVQPRRQQSLRFCEQVLHPAPCTDRDCNIQDHAGTNTDGLLLAVDKFLSTGEPQHPFWSNSRAVD